jgi:hypothetical protein
MAECAGGLSKASAWRSALADALARTRRVISASSSWRASPRRGCHGQESVRLGALTRSAAPGFASSGPTSGRRIAQRPAQSPSLLVLDNCEHLIRRPRSSAPSISAPDLRVPPPAAPRSRSPPGASHARRTGGGRRGAGYSAKRASPHRPGVISPNGPWRVSSAGAATRWRSSCRGPGTLYAVGDRRPFGTGSRCCAAATPGARPAPGPARGHRWSEPAAPRRAARCGGGTFRQFRSVRPRLCAGASAFGAVRGLVDQSLLRVADPAGSYRMLLREFGRMQLAGSQSEEDCHCPANGPSATRPPITGRPNEVPGSSRRSTRSAPGTKQATNCAARRQGPRRLSCRLSSAARAALDVRGAPPADALAGALAGVRAGCPAGPGERARAAIAIPRTIR